MTSSLKMIMLAGALALPASAVLAQTTGSAATGDGARLNGPAVVAPGAGGTTTSQGTHAPGSTGRTVVPGSNSTVAGDSHGTALGKSGTMPGQSGEGAGSGK